ncbi:MAG: hypothetical protein ACFFDH_12620 [Promethearchaeota archaeon]
MGYFYQISPIMFIGFGIIIFGFFLFFILNLKKEDEQFIRFRFLSENLMKIIILILMGISLFIPPISFPFTSISWTEVHLLNYFRGIICLIGCIYIPGVSLLSIFFPGDTLSKKFKIESFFIKLTISPLLSLLMIGTIVLILDYIGVNSKEIYVIVLLLFILFIVIIDFILQHTRFEKNIGDNIFQNKHTNIKISKSTFIILIFAMGVSLISLGIHSIVHYLITGDSWTVLTPTQFIGDPNNNPVNYGLTRRYPIFWCYVSYGLSVLNGLPFINTNAMMAPLCYLYVTSIYLLCKSILQNFNKIYAVLSAIIISIFSDLLVIALYYNNNAIVSSNIGGISILIFSGQFFFYYKSFALYLAFSSIAIFIFANNISPINVQSERNKKIDLKLIIFTGFFLTGSYVSYMLPLIPVMVIILIFYIFIKKKEKPDKYLIYFLVSLFLFFLIFDILTQFFSSFLFSDKFNDFIIWLLSLEYTDNFFINYIVYFYFAMFFIAAFILYFAEWIRKKSINSNRSDLIELNHNLSYKHRNIFLRTFKSQRNQKILLFIILIIFTLFLLPTIFSLYFKHFLFRFIYINKIYWLYSIFFLLDLVFLSLGFFGIFGIYVSPLCFKKNKRIFMVLILWIIFSLLYASLVHLANIYKELSLQTSPQDIEDVFIYYMIFWFTRNWYYAIIPLSIFSAIGIIDLPKIIRKIDIMGFNPIKRISLKNKVVIKFTFLTIIILFSYLNIMIAGIKWGRKYGEGTVSDAEAQVIGYLPIYIPNNSLILTEYKYSLFHGIRTMTNCNFLSTIDVFDPSLNYKSYIENLENRSIDYAVLYESSHFNIHPKIQSFLNNFLVKYYYTDILYKFQGLCVYKCLPIDTEPYYQASHDFFIFVNDTKLSAWGYRWKEFSSGDSKVRIIDEKDDHLKVMELKPKSGYASISKLEPCLTNGSVEFWLYTTDTSQSFTYEIYGSKGSMLQLLINNNQWKYVNKTNSLCNIPGLNSTPKDNTWYHVRIDFETLNQQYTGLNQSKWRVTIDGSDSSTEIDINDHIEGDCFYHNFHSGISSNYSLYIDAIGFSWDSYYKLGGNLNKSVFTI